MNAEALIADVSEVLLVYLSVDQLPPNTYYRTSSSVECLVDIIVKECPQLDQLCHQVPIQLIIGSGDSSTSSTVDQEDQLVEV